MVRWLLSVLLFLARPAWAAPTLYVVTPGPPQSVRFEARTQTERYAGQTNQVTGQVQADPERPAQSPSARLQVTLSALATGNSSRDSRMRRAFLETSAFPAAVFVLTHLDAPPAPLAPGRPVTGTARGTLTLHGVTREIAPGVTVTRERGSAGDALHIVARFVVRLADYRIPTPRLLFFSVRQEHVVTVDVRAVASRPPPQRTPPQSTLPGNAPPPHAVQ